jgi:hypothetical protein
LQEAAEDDFSAAGWDEPFDWLLRKVRADDYGYFRHGDHVRLRTTLFGVSAAPGRAGRAGRAGWPMPAVT